MGDHVISALLTAFLPRPAPPHHPNTLSPLIDSLQMSSVSRKSTRPDRRDAFQGNKQVSGQASEAAGDEAAQSVNAFWSSLSESVSCRCLLLPQHLDTQKQPHLREETLKWQLQSYMRS